MSHVMDPTLEQGKTTRSKTERTCEVLTTTPISPDPALLKEGEGRGIEKDVRPRKKEGMERKIWFYFSSYYSDLVGNNFTN